MRMWVWVYSRRCETSSEDERVGGELRDIPRQNLISDHTINPINNPDVNVPIIPESERIMK